MRRFLAALGAVLVLAAPALAAERKPLVIGATGQQQQIQATDTLKLPAATTANAPINIPQGTAPTSPNNGDCWTTASGLFCRIAGVTTGPYGTGAAGGSSGQLQYNASGALGGFTLAGDCTLSVPNITCTKASGVTLGYFATGTDASNLTGTLAAARIATNSLALTKLAQIGGNSYLGNTGSSTADITAYTLPNCTDGDKAYHYTLNVGFSCATITGVTGGTNPFYIGTPNIQSGSGSPAVSSDPVGSLYMRTDTAQLLQQTVATGTVPTLVQDMAWSGNGGSMGATPTVGNFLIATCYNYVGSAVAATGWTTVQSDPAQNPFGPSRTVAYRQVIAGDTASITPCSGADATAAFEVSGMGPSWAASFARLTTIMSGFGTGSITSTTLNANSLVIGSIGMRGSIPTYSSGLSTSPVTSSGSAVGLYAATGFFVSSGATAQITLTGTVGGDSLNLIELKPPAAGWRLLSPLATIKNAGTTLTTAPISLNCSTNTTCADDGLGNITLTAAATPSAANPTATASDTAVNGSASTFMRSDAAPAVQKGSSSAFGVVKVDNTTITASGGVISAVAGGGTVTVSGTPTTGNCAKFSSSTVITDAGAACGSGGGGGGSSVVVGSSQVLATTTLSAAAATIDFTSIPQGYSDIRIVLNGRGDTAATSTPVKLTFNGDTGANYDSERTYSLNGGSNAAAAVAGNYIYFADMSAATAPASISTSSDFTIYGYSGTTFQKASNGMYGLKQTNTGAGLFQFNVAGFWRSSAAITQATLTPTTGNFAAGTTATLYGIGGTPVQASAGFVSGMTLIQTQQLANTAASVSFNSIPQGYSDLVLVANARGDTAASSTQMRLTVNGDSGANYDKDYIFGSNNTVASAASAGDTFFTVVDMPAASASAGLAGFASIQFFNYTGSAFHKTFVSEAGSRQGTAASTFELLPQYGDWRSTSAITSLTLVPQAGNFTAGSTFSLYGRGGSNVTVNPAPGLPIICEVVTSGSASSVTIGGGSGACPTLAQTYRDLKVVVTGRATTAVNNDTVAIRFNGDTAANYDTEYFLAFSNAVANNFNAESVAQTSALIGFIPGASATASLGGTIDYTVGNYANTTFNKSGMFQTNQKWANAINSFARTVGSNAWRSSAAITSMTIFPSGGNFVDGTVITVYGIGGSPTATLPVVPPQGRLTLTSATPVMNADATAQSTIYYTPYQGNLLPVGNIMYQFSQITYALNTTAHASGSLYDVFAFNNAGALALCTGPAWTSSTARSAAISMSNGIWTNTASLTCNLTASSSTTTIAAANATYLGTFYATANGQTGMQFTPAAAAGGSNTILGLYNAYNRVRVASYTRDSTTSWTYNAAAWRASDNSSSNRVRWVDGLQQSAPEGSFMQVGQGITAWGVGVALDSTTGDPPFTTQINTATITTQSAPYTFLPQLGFHYVQAMETAYQTNAATFFGAAVGPNRQMHGLTIVLEMGVPWWCVPLAAFRRRKRSANDNAADHKRAA